MEKQVFVARQEELARLDSFLKRALNGQGTVCFVTGEAGSGKTMLVSEFARRAQEQVANLAVAVGQSDAQTGVGDAHLPFREILGQLTGDVDAKLSQRVISEENAGRLRKLLALSGQALVEVGPDLIGIFVPGIGLATRLGAFMADKAGWMDKLEKLAGKQPEPAGQGSAGIQQSHIFEQYANVLKKLSGEQTLLLVLDDLQWADTASIALLFHLARRIGENRILIVGTFRPEEVAIGRAGERHPLEKVLAELKRYYGDLRVDLDQAEQLEGQRFVDAYLDTEPNLLGEDFRHKLYAHTGGHALFTIELLRDMQERGDLVQNWQGRWVETPVLNWEALPERVEGVIEERIGRLGHELRQLLTIGSVEGENFTAEVVARVQTADAQGLIRKLSGELDRQHRLVSAQGVRRIDSAGQRLSLYRFQHNLFRTYLYNELDEAERVYLHEDVGRVLEELYGAQAHQIAVQLAWHFEEAGITDKARHYLNQAGEQAAASFANAEAIAYFTRALAMLPAEAAGAESSEMLVLRYDICLRREDVYAMTGERQAQKQDLVVLASLAERLDDEAKHAEVLLREARYAEMVGDYPAALTVLEAALQAARSAHDIHKEARAMGSIGHILWRQGNFKQSLVQSELALDLARTAKLHHVEASCLHSRAVAYWRLGKHKEARDSANQCLELSRAINDRRTQSMAFSILGNIHLDLRDYDVARANYEENLHIDAEIGDLRGQAMMRGNLGIIAEIQGDFSLAMERFQQVSAIFHDIGDRSSEARAWAHLGLNADLQGLYEIARSWYEKALQAYLEIGEQQGQLWVLTQISRLFGQVGSLDQAEGHAHQALQLAQNLSVRGAEASSWSLLARFHELNGAYEQALDAYQTALAIVSELGDKIQVLENKAGLARVSLAQGNLARAKELVDEVWGFAENQPIEGTNDDVFEVYWTCYSVLRAVEDDRAPAALRTMYQRLQDHACRISDEASRRSYLHNVAVHRKIVEEFAKEV